MLKKFLLAKNMPGKWVSTTTSDWGTNFSKCLRESHMNPIQVRYQAALHPELFESY